MKRRARAEVRGFCVEGLEVLVIDLDGRGAGAAELTAAERSVAGLAAGGATNQEIAEARGTSVRTVANQLAAIYRKLHVVSRFELAALWDSTL